jgi:cytidyltransferase-like protein
MKIIIVSGGFDPLHIGHLRYLKEAKKLGDKLIVILNNDDFLQKKKGYSFMPMVERQEILEALECVDTVIPSIDSDDKVSTTLAYINDKYPMQELVFAKGGDRTRHNVPEIEYCNENRIEVVFGVGGGKIQSSSELVANVKNG